jgi:hypothetical protein
VYDLNVLASIIGVDVRDDSNDELRISKESMAGMSQMLNALSGSNSGKNLTGGGGGGGRGSKTATKDRGGHNAAGSGLDMFTDSVSTLGNGSTHYNTYNSKNGHKHSNKAGHGHDGSGGSDLDDDGAGAGGKHHDHLDKMIGATRLHSGDDDNHTSISEDSIPIDLKVRHCHDRLHLCYGDELYLCPVDSQYDAIEQPTVQSGTTGTEHGRR